jgi:hypothetical protein
MGAGGGSKVTGRALKKALWLVWAFWTVWAGTSASAATLPQIEVYGNLPEGCRGEPRTVSLESYRDLWATLETEDPNFPAQGPGTYRGVYLGSLLDELGVATDTQITFLAEDHYVLAMPRLMFSKMKAFLAFERDGNPISPLKGGPLKIVFPKESEADPAAYIWYVKAFWIGKNCGSSVQVVDTSGRAATFTFPSSQKELFLKRIPTTVPKGYRAGWEPPPVLSEVRGLLLRDVLGGNPSGVHFVEFVPLVGKSLHLPWEVAERIPILLVNIWDGRPVPVAFGGPVWVLLPTAEYRELLQWVGEAPAFFFLKAVRLHP